MAGVIELDRPGGPEALVWRDADAGAPGPGEALVRHAAVGVNFLDIYFRSGLYPWPAPAPLVLGAEAAGQVIAVGPDVDQVAVGDRVAYTTPYGAYREVRRVPADRLLPLPASVSEEVAAASVLKGLTAHYLLRRTFRVGPEHTVLFHAAAGGVGSIAGRWLAHLGATSIGTVGSPAKVERARAAGYTHVVDYAAEDFVERVAELTEGKGVDVVYDSVGRDTYPGSLRCLRPLGTFVSFGQSSGRIEGFQLTDLSSHGSLFATRPTLFDYVAARSDLLAAAAETFGLIEQGTLTPTIGLRLPLREAAEAHRLLEGRRTTGSTVLLP